MDGFYGNKFKMKLSRIFTLKHALDKGYDNWTEWGWLHEKMGISMNATEYHLGSSGLHLVWTNMYDVFFHDKTFEWRTIKGGMSRFTNAFLPMLGDKIRYNTRVSKIEFFHQIYDDDNEAFWKNDPSDKVYQTKSFDNVIVSVPFVVMRTWHLPQALPYTLKRAIQNLEHGDSCKVILEFETPFWQYYDEKPILGGCDSTDLPIGLVCYPTAAVAKKKGVDYNDDRG
ncbi:hypothetical protein BDB00DRAFT_866781 [Zychaea mexicana]|uniref:uncharacterized protein n=1 Tax=Zychaea mexicana TaxID=64656 RepID=UPI0022FEBB41|nr:uncharacterized protein BDB00DRAFT_866781 [Zychaea mexicana]KAI9499296.1 hypothetical protein BDB00DRAFT_866781 [Zychaea mexicana]